MDNKEVLVLFDKELRKNLQISGFRREETEHVVRHVSLHGERGFISSSDVDETNARKVIQDEMNYFSELGVGFEWKVYSYDKPDHLKDLLEQEQFEIEPVEALMIKDIGDDHPIIQENELNKIQEIVDEQGVRDIISLLHTIWGEWYDELGNRLWRDKQNNADSLFLYGIYDEDQLVSAAWMYFERDASFASLWGGATLPEYRGKGNYSSLLAVREKKAKEQGYKYLTVDASPMSRPILEKYGFSCLAYTYGCQSPDMPNK